METTAVSPPEADVMPSVATPPQLLYATGWQRTGAMLIDGILCGLPFFLVMKLFYGHPLLLMNLTNLLVCLYYVIPESMFRFGSPGKMLLGLYVARSDGSSVALSHALWRYFLWILPGVPLLVIGYMPELLAYSAAVGENDPEKLRVLLSDPATREALRLQFFCIIGWLGASLLLQAMPMFATKEKIGLHDWLSNTRVYRKPDRAPAYFATPSQRFGAMVLDIIFWMIFTTVLEMIIVDTKSFTILNRLLFICYFTVAEGSRLQASIGKHLLDIKVVNTDGKPTTFLRAGVRALCFESINLVTTILMLFSPRVWDFYDAILASRGDTQQMSQTVSKFVGNADFLEWMKTIILLNSFIFGLGLVLFCFPVIFPRQRTGLQDWLSGTRVYRRDATPGA